MITAYIAYPESLGTAVLPASEAAEVQAIAECRARGVSATLAHAVGITPDWGAEPTLRLDFVAPDVACVRALVASLLQAWDQTCALVMILPAWHVANVGTPLAALWYADGRPDERLE